MVLYWLVVPFIAKQAAGLLRPSSGAGEVTPFSPPHPPFFKMFFSLAASLVLFDKGQVLVDVVDRTDHEGNPLVQRLRLDVQDPLRAGGGQASGLLDEEGDGVALVQQPQLWREQPLQWESHSRDRIGEWVELKLICC